MNVTDRGIRNPQGVSDNFAVHDDLAAGEDVHIVARNTLFMPC
jgi:hypothetical protein